MELKTNSMTRGVITVNKLAVIFYRRSSTSNIAFRMKAMHPRLYFILLVHDWLLRTRDFLKAYHATSHVLYSFRSCLAVTQLLHKCRPSRDRNITTANCL